MKKILKVIMLSIARKKGRTFLLILSILFSVGLTYAVLSLSSLTEVVVMNYYEKEYGNTDVLIYKEDNTFIEQDLEIEDDSYNYLIEGYNLYGYSYLDEDLAVDMYGYTTQDIDSIYDLILISTLDGEFDSNNVLIGSKNASKYDLEIGDTISVSIGSVSYEFVIYGIAIEGTSFLDANPNTLDLIITKDFVINTLGLVNPNIILLNTKDTINLELLEEQNTGLRINNLFDQEDISASLQQITIPIGIMAMTIVLIGSFIISSTFKVIVIDRMAFLGTLRSIGATKKMTLKVLIIESALYGLIGSIIGIGVGVFFLSFMETYIFGPNFSDGLGVKYLNISFALIAIIFGVLISILSSLPPILNTRNYSIKDIIFQKIKNVKKVSINSSIIGTLMIITGFILMNNVGTNDYMTFSMITIILSIVGAILVIPLLVTLINPVLSKVLYPIFKNKADIASKNIKHDKTLINNIVLLAIGLGAIFMINSFSNDVGPAVEEEYELAQYDMLIQNETIDNDFILEIENIDGVDHVYITGSAHNVETTNGFILPYLDSIDPNMYAEYGWDIIGDGVSLETINTFNTSNAIIVNEFIAKKYELEINDTVEIINNGITTELTIVGTYQSIMFNGVMSYISHDTFASIFGTDTLNTIYINSIDDVETVRKNIKESYNLGVLPIDTLKELKDTNEESNKMLFSLLTGISLLAMLIGAIGIINNFTVSFISRRKLVGSLRSLGLSKTGTIKLFMIESLMVGMIGSILGVLFGIMFYHFMGFVVEGMNINSDLQTYDMLIMLYIFLSGLILSIITSVLPSINMSRRNIVNEIKYE
ncbi:MAG: FtsX-like permease family protein [Tenericutes bacterium]|nr:FtsX-like permease family protein [Mycoplasmatota bacterium]